MRPLDCELTAALAELSRASLRRQLRVIESAQGPRVAFQGRSLVMLSSNNYLDLAGHPELKRAAAEAVAVWGVGAGASRLVSGNLKPIHELEERLAALKRTEAALVFGSGYLANLGIIQALAGPEDVILSDALNHASLIDGCRLSRATLKIYRHCDAADLQVLLEKCPASGRRLIVTDSVFSMDGDCAPLAEIAALAERYKAAVMIDEAHAVGVFGPGGSGLAAALGIDDRIDIKIGTLSKALGAYGAYVAGSRPLIDYLINRARSFIYTTGLAPAIAAAAGAAIGLIACEPERIERLWANAEYLRDGLAQAGFRIGPSTSPIIPVIIGEADRALAVAEGLFARGFYVIAIRPPTVPAGTARLRVTPTAGHSRELLDDAIAAFAAVGRETGAIQAGAAAAWK